MNPSPYKQLVVDGRHVMEHIYIAETVLGRRLPKGAVVHHVDHDRRNNAKSNFVICPSQAYHLLIHLRERALIATGNPNMIPCHICKQWDLPENLYFRKSRPGQWHRACNNAKHKQRMERKKNGE